MSTDVAQTAEGWSLDMVEDVDLPGWVLLPYGAAEDLRGPWATEVAAAVRTLPPLPELSSSEEDISALLRAGLEIRDESSSALLYLVFPAAAAVATLCSVDFIRTSDLPQLASTDGRSFPAEARHIGPGLQWSTRRTIADDDGTEVEISSVHLVFCDEEHGIMISLGEAASLTVSQTLTGMAVLKNAIEVTRPDGTTLRSTASSVLLEESVWTADEKGVS